jgi:uncharacterized protein (DUF58 family)
VIRLRRRAAGLAVGAALLFLVGTNVQSGWLFVLSSLLLGAVLSGVILPLRMVRGLTVTRRAPAEGFVGEDVPVDLVLATRGRGFKASITVRDPHVAPATVFVPSLRPGQTVTASTLRRASRRGVVDGAPVEIASSAPFGVAEARRRIPAGGSTVIYPRVVPVPSLAFLGSPRAAGEQAVRTAARGSGQDFHGVREYQRGDSLRHVHWPSTARHGSLIVREFEPERPAGLVVMIDTWADAGEPEHEETALDLCCSSAGSIALAAMASGHEVSVGAARDRAIAPPERMDRTAALTWLAGLQAPGGLSLAVAIAEVAPFIHGPLTCVMAFPTWRANAARPMARAVSELTAAGVRVVAAVIDAATLDPAVSVLTDAEVEELYRGLSSRGVHVFLIRPQEDLAACLARSPSTLA